MNLFSIKNDFKDHIDKLWSYPKFLTITNVERGYAVQDEVIREAILFIGINPSFSGKHLKKNSHFYNNDQEGNVYSYFRKFQDIAKRTGQKWAHVDLIYIRETKQKIVERIFSHEHGSDFISAQLDLSKKIIEKASPKIIVVSNAFARTLFSKRFQIEFDENIGTHKIIDGKLNNVPVFFTSMLTGQRALDLGSYERLIWHIKKVLN